MVSWSVESDIVSSSVGSWREIELVKNYPPEFYACGVCRFRVAATSGTYWQPRPQPRVSQKFPPAKKISPGKKTVPAEFMRRPHFDQVADSGRRHVFPSRVKHMSVKNYPTLKFMIPAVGATTSVPHASFSTNHSPLPDNLLLLLYVSC